MLSCIFCLKQRHSIKLIFFTEKLADEEDAESGNGPSLPQSPNSVEGAIGGPKSLDSDFDESTKQFESGSLDVSMSLCGGIDSEPSNEAFQLHALRYEDVCTDPKIYENPNLVVKVNGKFYNYSAACSVVMTFATYQRHLPSTAVSTLYEDKKRLSDKMEDGRSSTEDAGASTGGYSSWFSWRRSSQPTKKSPNSSIIKGTQS